MTPEEAIERNEKHQLPIKTEEDYKNHEALRLGIEALKRVKESRLVGSKGVQRPLPGETKE